MSEVELMSPPPVSSAAKYLTFTLAQETYAWPILGVREIIRLCPITPVPRMPSHLQGVINLRGSVVSVLDLRAKFQISEGTYGDRACIIVVQVPLPAGGHTLMGAIVDTVEEVVSLALEDIEPAPDFGGQPDTRYIAGVASVHGKVKTLLNIEKIFMEEDSSKPTDALPPREITRISVTPLSGQADEIVSSPTLHLPPTQKN